MRRKRSLFSHKKSSKKKKKAEPEEFAQNFDMGFCLCTNPWMKEK